VLLALSTKCEIISQLYLIPLKIKVTMMKKINENKQNPKSKAMRWSFDGAVE